METCNNEEEQEEKVRFSYIGKVFRVESRHCNSKVVRITETVCDSMRMLLLAPWALKSIHLYS